VVLSGKKQSQTKPICRPLAGNSKHEARNTKQKGFTKLF